MTTLKNVELFKQLDDIIDEIDPLTDDELENIKAFSKELYDYVTMQSYIEGGNYESSLYSSVDDEKTLNHLIELAKEYLNK